MRARFEAQGDVGPLRPMMEKMARDARPVPAHVRLEAHALGAVPGERLVPAGARDDAAILYVHGGAFIAGAPVNHRALTWRLAHGTGTTVYAIDYRLAPEHPFPAGLDDVVQAYEVLVARGVRRIAIGGDSAGGNLALAAALELARRGAPRPAALACLSPVTTLALDLPSAFENRDRDDMFSFGLMPGMLARYAKGHDPFDPRISPLHAKDVSVLPPTIFQVGEREMLRDHSVQMAERMRAAGVEVRLEVEPRVMHVWQLLADLVPEAHAAIDRLSSFLRPRLSS